MKIDNDMEKFGMDQLYRQSKSADNCENRFSVRCLNFP